MENPDCSCKLTREASDQGATDGTACECLATTEYRSRFQGQAWPAWQITGEEHCTDTQTENRYATEVAMVSQGETCESTEASRTRVDGSDDWCGTPHGLSSNKMALITTDFDAMRSLRTKWP